MDKGGAETIMKSLYEWMSNTTCKLYDGSCFVWNDFMVKGNVEILVGIVTWMDCERDFVDVNDDS